MNRGHDATASHHHKGPAGGAHHRGARAVAAARRRAGPRPQTRGWLDLDRRQTTLAIAHPDGQTRVVLHRAGSTAGATLTMYDDVETAVAADQSQGGPDSDGRGQAG